MIHGTLGVLSGGKVKFVLYMRKSVLKCLVTGEKQKEVAHFNQNMFFVLGTQRGFFPSLP